MKIIYLITMLSLFLFGSVLFPNYAGAVACQNKTVIAYSNGMFTKKSDARKSLKKLKEKLIQKSIVFDNVNVYDYNLAYANGKGGPVGTTALDQLLEAVFVKQVVQFSDHPVLRLCLFSCCISSFGLRYVTA